jgi:hypothetical protein
MFKIENMCYNHYVPRFLSRLTCSDLVLIQGVAIVLSSLIHDRSLTILLFSAPSF